MALTVGGTPVKSVYVGSTPVKAVYVGSQKVWPIQTETVQITLGAGYQARDQFRAALADRGLDYQTVVELPFDIELVGTGSVRDMFRDCAALTTVPAMDTSSVTDMRNMFYDCAALTYVPDMDTSQVTDMGHMFRRCSSLTYVPDMDTSQVTDMYAMFYNCSALTDGNVRLIGKHPNVDTDFMIANSGLTREPFYKADGTPDDPPTGPRVVTVQTTRNEWIVGSQSGDVSMIQELTGPSRLVFSAPVTCDQAINAGSAGTLAAGNRLEAGWILARVGFGSELHTFTEIL